jgi:heptosyltransferase-2
MNLVLRFSALGDIVLCSAFVRALEGPTLFVTQNTFKGFVEEFFDADQLKVYGLPKPKWGLVGWFLAGRRFASFLRIYAAPRISELKIYDLHNVSKSLLFSWGLLLELERLRLVAKISIRRTPKERLRRWALLLFKKDFGGTSDPVFKRHLSLLTSEIPRQQPSLKVHSSRTKHFPGSGISIKLLMAPDAQHWKKIWPLNYWQNLLKDLSQIKSIPIEVTLVSQRRLIDPSFIQSLSQSSSPFFRLRDLQGRTQLLELPILAAEHDLLICGNTAWLHIAEAVGTPVLSLAGPIVSEFGFSPFLKNSYELSSSIFCRPCSLHGGGFCPWTGDWHHACMKRLTPALVQQRLWKQLGYGSPPS